MSKKTTRVLSMVLAIALVVTMMAGVMTAGAKTYKDIYNGHWAQQYIAYLSDKGVFEGNPDGTFAPDKAITTAEMMAVINRTFGLSVTSGIYYSDVKSTDWFYTDVQKAKAQGYIIADGYYVYPNQGLTREKAVAMIAKYLGLDPVYNSSIRFADANTINAAYVGYVNAAVSAGIINGYIENGTYYFKPQQALQRDEVAKIIYTMLSGNIITSNVTGVTANGGCVTKGYVTVSNSYLGGTVYVTEGAVGGVTFSNCRITRLVVRGNTSVTLNNTTVGNLELDSSSGSATVYASGNSSVTNTYAKNTAYLTDGTTDGGIFYNVTSELPAGQTLTLTGIYPNVIVANPNTTLHVTSDASTISSLKITDNAANTKVTGKGVITNISVNASGVTTQQLPINYVIAKNLTATFAGGKYSGSGTTARSNSGFVVGYPSVSASYSASTGKTSISVSVKSVANGKVYVVAYPAAYSAPTASSIISYAGSNTSYVGTVADVTANTAKTISLTVNNTAYGNDYNVAAIFVPTNGTSSTYAPVYAKVLTGYTTYMSVSTALDTYFISNPQVTAYTAPTSTTNGSLSVAFKAGLPGTVYVYAYNANTTSPTASTIKAYGTAVTLSYSNGTYSGTGTVTLNKNTTYNAVAAVFVPSYSTYAMTVVRSTSLSVGSYLSPVVAAPTAAVNSIYLSDRSSNTDTAMTMNINAAVPGTLYFAVVKADEYPNADTIKAAAGSANQIQVLPAQVNTLRSKSFNTGTYSSSYKIVAVFVPDVRYSSFAAVYYQCILGNTANPINKYTPANVSWSITDGNGNGVVTAGESLIITFNQKMYYKNGTTYTELASASNLKALFKVTGGTASAPVAFDAYTVTVSNPTAATTKVVLTPTTSWPDGADLTVSNSVTNVNGQYASITYTDFYKVTTTAIPTIKVNGETVTTSKTIQIAKGETVAATAATTSAQELWYKGPTDSAAAKTAARSFNLGAGTHVFFTKEGGAVSSQITIVIQEVERITFAPVDTAKFTEWREGYKYTFTAVEGAVTYEVTAKSSAGFNTQTAAAAAELEIPANILTGSNITLNVVAKNAEGEIIGLGVEQAVTMETFGSIVVKVDNDENLFYEDSVISFEHTCSLANKPTFTYFVSFNGGEATEISAPTFTDNKATATITKPDSVKGNFTVVVTAKVDDKVATTSNTLSLNSVNGSEPVFEVTTATENWTKDSAIAVKSKGGDTLEIYVNGDLKRTATLSKDVEQTNNYYLYDDGKVQHGSAGTSLNIGTYEVRVVLIDGSAQIGEETLTVTVALPSVSITAKTAGGAAANASAMTPADYLEFTVGAVPAGYDLVLKRGENLTVWNFTSGTKRYINFNDCTLPQSATESTLHASEVKSYEIEVYFALTSDSTHANIDATKGAKITVTSVDPKTYIPPVKVLIDKTTLALNFKHEGADQSKFTYQWAYSTDGSNPSNWTNVNINKDYNVATSIPGFSSLASGTVITIGIKASNGAEGKMDYATYTVPTP